MKKEYLIPVALIALLSAYLVFHNENADHYTLPQVAKMPSAQIKGLLIENKDGKIELAKKDKAWILKPDGYPADNASVQDMLDALQTFKLSALVSQKKDFNRYELDDENKIKVTVIKSDNTEFEFTIGKVASTMNHTFVMLKNDANVYHASGSFRTYFADTKEGYRDKTVLKFENKSIKQFSIRKGDLAKTFIADIPKDKKDSDAVTWNSQDGQATDQQMVSDLLSALGHLECELFFDENKTAHIKKSEALYSITLKNGKPMGLTLIKNDEKKQLDGVSSMTPFGFQLSQFNTDDMVSKLDNLLGIEQEEADTQN